MVVTSLTPSSDWLRQIWKLSPFKALTYNNTNTLVTDAWGPPGLTRSDGDRREKHAKRRRYFIYEAKNLFRRCGFWNDSLAPCRRGLGYAIILKNAFVD